MNGQWLTKLNFLGITLCESNSSHLKMENGWLKMDGWNTSQSDHFRYQAPPPKKILPKLATGGTLSQFSVASLQLISVSFNLLYVYIYIYTHIFFLKWCVSCKAFDVFFAKIPPTLFRHRHICFKKIPHVFFPSCAFHVGIHPSIHTSTGDEEMLMPS